jgi:hypothetical protein
MPQLTPDQEKFLKSKEFAQRTRFIKVSGVMAGTEQLVFIQRENSEELLEKLKNPDNCVLQILNHKGNPTSAIAIPKHIDIQVLKMAAELVESLLYTGALTANPDYVVTEIQPISHNSTVITADNGTLQ